MEESGLREDIIQSAEEFAAQFDPNSESYHQGLPVPVPLGGNRVPENMPTVYAETEEEVKLTSEYEELFNLRTTINEFKREMTKIVPAIENKIRFIMWKSKKKQEQVNAREDEIIMRSIQMLWQYIDIIGPYQQFLKLNYSELLNQISENAMHPYSSKDELNGFSMLLKNAAQKIFADLNFLLERIKAVKKG